MRLWSVHPEYLQPSGTQRTTIIALPNSDDKSECRDDGLRALGLFDAHGAIALSTQGGVYRVDLDAPTDSRLRLLLKDPAIKGYSTLGVVTGVPVVAYGTLVQC